MLNGLRTNCYKVTMLFQRQGDKKSVWICPAHPHTIYAFITKELRLKRLLVKFQNNFFRHFTRIARRTHIGNSRSGQTRQVFFLNAQFRQMLRDTYLDRQLPSPPQQPPSQPLPGSCHPCTHSSPWRYLHIWAKQPEH